jgi:hypothetical protein
LGRKCLRAGRDGVCLRSLVRGKVYANGGLCRTLKHEAVEKLFMFCCWLARRLPPLLGVVVYGWPLALNPQWCWGPLPFTGLA